MRPVLAIIVLSGCAEPVITLALKLPPSQQTAGVNLSCVSAIDVYALGHDRGYVGTPEAPGVPADDEVDCVDVQGLTTFDQIRGAIRDQIQVDIPESGLAGVELYGWSGTSCKNEGFATPIFYGGTTFNEGDVLVTIPVGPNVSCDQSVTKIRPVDLFKLTASPTHDCAAAAIAESPQTGIDTVVLQSTLLDGPYMPFGGTSGSVHGGLVTVPSYSAVATAARACPAGTFGDGAALTAGSCLRPGPGVCNQPGEIELPVVNGFTTDNLLGKSPDKQFTGMIVGAVWGIDAAGAKAPLVGATVTVDPKQGRVVYADFSPDPTITLDVNATAAKASGMFVVYANDFINITVSAPGYISETVHTSPNGYSDSTILPVLRHQ